MADSDKCPKCAKQLPEDAPSGLCPSCLLAEAIVLPEPDSGLDRFHSPTTPGQTRFVPPSVASLTPLFPQLEILSLLGHGGMGAVYKAKQKKLDRLVALKIIRPEAAADPAFAERFNREARTLARLSHPHIVAVHDFGEITAGVAGATSSASGPLFYFLMEYVDGANLRQLMDDGRLDPQQSLAIVPQVCDALQFAHDEGVIHRDIKPENILIDTKGRVKIADFGLAKLAVGGPDEFTLTGTHQVMGTPRYMAPEQMEGSHAVDHRADIYSLGVVFYEMLTGQVPAGHFEPPSRKAAIDPGLDAVVLRAMAREPERRFQQASELRSEVVQAKGAPPYGMASRLPAENRSVSDGGFPAISSLMSREAMAVWKWVAGPAELSAEQTPAPRWLMLLLSLAACGMLFLPWIDIYVNDLDATRGLDGQFLVQYENGVAYHREIAPLELRTGGVCAVFTCLLLISQVIAVGRNKPSFVAAVIGLVFCSFALLSLTVHRSELWYWKVTVFGDPATGAMPQSALNYGTPPGVGDSFLGPLHHVIRYRAPFFVEVASLLGLLCLLGMEFRHSLTAPRAQPSRTTTPQSRSVTSVRRWLMAAVAVLMHSAIGTSLFVLDDRYALDNSFHPLSTVLTNQIILFAQGLCFPVTVLTLVAVIGMKHGHSWRLATIACLLLLVPFTPAWIFTMPVAALCLSVLYRPDVRRLFGTDESNSVSERQTAVTPLERMAFWLRAAGIATGISAAITLILTVGIFDSPYRMQRGDDEVLFTLAVFQVLCLPLAVMAFIAAYGLRQKQHLRLAKAVCFLLLVPCTPSWVVAMPVAIWCLSVLQRKEILFLLENGGVAVDEVKEADAPVPSDPVVPLTECAAVSSPLSTAWNVWWSGRHLWTTRVIQTALSLIFVVSFVLFISFGTTFSHRYREVHDLILASSRPALQIDPTEVSNDLGPVLEAELQAAIAADNLEKVNELMSLGMHVNHRSSSGRTPLEQAIVAGCERIAAFLILRGADMLQRNPDGRIPLDLAVEGGHADVVRMLLDMEKLPYDQDVQFRMTRIDSTLQLKSEFTTMRFNAGVEMADREGVTPYMRAAALGNLEIFRMFAAESLCNGFDRTGRSWISHAIEQRREEFLVAFLDEVIAMVPLIPPNHSSGSRVTPALLAHVDGSGHRPLEAAQATGLTAVAERIERYCNLIIEKCDRDQTESPGYADFNAATRALCLRALGSPSAAPASQLPR